MNATTMLRLLGVRPDLLTKAVEMLLEKNPRCRILRCGSHEQSGHGNPRERGNHRLELFNTAPRVDAV